MSIVYLLKLTTALLLGPFFFAAAMLRCPFGYRAALQVFRSYLRLVFALLGVQVCFEFDEPSIRQSTGSLLVVLNQSSFLDSLACPLAPLGSTKGIINFEFALFPFIGWLTALVSFTIVRQWPGQAKRTLNRAGAFMRTGGNIFISIEGRRSRDGKINDYKKGPVVMAINNQCDIVPIVIHGSRSCLPFGSVRVRPGTLRLRFLQPISTRGLSYADRNSLRDRLLALARTEGLA